MGLNVGFLVLNRLYRFNDGSVYLFLIISFVYY